MSAYMEYDLLTQDFTVNSKCVFARMECLKDKYSDTFSLKQRLDLSYDYCCSQKTQDFGNGDFFTHVEDLLGSENIQKLSEYKKVKGIWNLIRTIDSPILYDKDNDVTYEGKLYLKEVKADFVLVEDVKPYYGTKIGTGETPAEKAQAKAREYETRPKQIIGGDRPLTPVMSSTVMSRAVKNDKLYVRFHSSPNNTYKYAFGSNDEALKAFDEMTESSPGRWVWKNLRGHSKGEPTGIDKVPEKYGRVAGSGKTTVQKGGKKTVKGRMTIGGLGSEGDKAHHYEKIGKVIAGINEVPHMEKLAKEMRKFKMEVKEDDPTSGEPFTVDELEKYSKKIYEEKEKRKGIHEELQQMFKKMKEKKFKKKPKEKPDESAEREKQFEEQISARTESPEARVRRTGGDFDTSKPGRWITVGGKHIYLYEGQKLKFGEKGKIIQVVKKDKESEKLKKKKLKKEISDAGKDLKSIKKGIKQLGEKKRKKGLASWEQKDYKFLLEHEARKYKQLNRLKTKLILHKESEDFDESKGRWVTIKGKHIFIQKGQKLTFGEGGKYKIEGGKPESKKEEVIRKAKEREESRSKEEKEESRRKVYETDKQKKERESKEKESTKQEQSEEKERLRRRKEIDRMARATKKDKPTPEREKGIQSIIEKKGYERERAEKEYDEKHPKKPEVPSKKEIERKETKRIKTESKITKKKITLDKKITKLKELNKGKTGGEHIDNFIRTLTKVVQEIESDDGFVGVPIAQHIDKIRKDKKLTEERKRKLIEQIKKLNNEISTLKEPKKDFELLTEIMELEKELETYDYYVDDHIEEFLDYIEKEIEVENV